MVSGGGKLQNADRQMSEAFITSVFLAMSGGFQDAYTYFTRDEVFSNAQTGNVVLMSQNFMTGQWGDGLRYLFPVLAFAIGVVAAERIQNTFKYAKKLQLIAQIFQFSFRTAFFCFLTGSFVLCPTGTHADSGT